MQMGGSVQISVVTPVYGKSLDLEALHARLCTTLERIVDSFEILMVDDANPTDSWSVITRLASIDPRVRGIALSRNFGQHRAIAAGLDHVKGEWVVVMDCDLQDRPEAIADLYEAVQKGYDIVTAQRTNRQSPLLERLTSKIFYRVFKSLSQIDHDSSVSSFGIYSRASIEAVKSHGEQSRSFGMIVNLIGFRRTSTPVEHSRAVSGRSNYTFLKRLQLAMDIIVAHSNKPLRLSIKIGFIMALCSFLYGIKLIVNYLLTSQAVVGWTSLMVSIYLVGGLIILNLGILGLYLGKVYDEVKARPVYLIRDTTFV
jgi:dolichol-phosphate mannosyltransferase